MRELYVINLGGVRYAVGKQSVRSIDDDVHVHRLPLSSPMIAGIAVFDGKSATLYDLAACVGLPPADASQGGRVLFVDEGKRQTGFFLRGEVEEAAVPDDDVHPLPEYVRSSLSRECVVLESRPVPLIELGRLSARADTRDDPPAATHPEATSGADGKDRGVRLVIAGGHLFALPADTVRGDAVPIPAVGAMAGGPRHVKGLVIHEGAVLPAVSLAELLALPMPAREGAMLIAGTGGRDFALLIEEDRGMTDAGTAVIKDMPPVAETGWTNSVALQRGNAVPLIDLHAALYGRRETSTAALAGRYAPDSRFAEAFGRSDVEVLEFSLLGVRHALPRSEVEGILPFRPFRPIPGALPVVIGVAEHNGNAIPVLDLAMVFGRRSLAGPSWSMVLVRNGDFRAFVITAEVYGSQTLPRDVQRRVPIILPHDLVYGCYVESAVVRLILNAEALAVHFDLSVVKDLLPAFTSEMAKAPAETVPFLLPDADTSVLESGPYAPAVYLDPEAVPIGSEAAARAADAEAEALALAQAEQLAREAEERAGKAAVEDARREAEKRKLREEMERSRAEAEARAKAEAEELKRREQEARAQLEAEERARREAEERAKRLAEEQALAEAKSRAEREERARREAEERERAASEERKRREAEEQKRQAEERARAEREERERREREEKARREAADIIRETHKIGKRPAAAVMTPAPGPVATLRQDRDPSSASIPENRPRVLAKGKKYAWAAAAVLALTGLIYFGLMSATRGARPPAERSRPDDSLKGASPRMERESPLVLTVPAERELKADFYVVRKGDTLWDICERFTGDPFKYPRVASDNRIANPDLIFPGQKIRLKK